MEYWRTDDNQILADFAYRAGIILCQYEKLILRNEKKFESTLYIIALQSLLTQCQELYRAMKKADQKKEFLCRLLSEEPELWGLSKGLIKIDSFGKGPITYDTIITYIRNALSHPTALDLNSEFPSTGYTTIKDKSRIVKEFCFVNSPDTKNNRIKEFPNRESAKKAIAELQGVIPDVSIKEKHDKKRTFYQLEKDGKPFARIFRIDIPVPVVRDFVLGLSTYLAQPVQKNWDGRTVNNDLFAA
jgi:hypothetical protein